MDLRRLRHIPVCSICLRIVSCTAKMKLKFADTTSRVEADKQIRDERCSSFPKPALGTRKSQCREVEIAMIDVPLKI